jgi:translation initiation factor 1
MDIDILISNTVATAPAATNTAKIHVRVHQRNTRSFITTIEGLDDDLDLVRICRAMKRAFNCNGNVKTGTEYGDIIQLQGDQHETVKAWLVQEEVLTAAEAEERLVVHGA